MLVTLLGAYALACSYVYLVPSLPSIESMRNVELQVPLRVYTRTGALIAQIGEQRRIPVTYDQIPELVKHAFLAAEDERFFEHHGIDYFGVVRAVLVDVVSGDKSQGASTITMQAARNMFLSLDKTARRKLQETFVTYRMEHEFTKQEIFGLYLNVIFFGQRAYGVAAAAEAFFGKTLDKLDVAEAATIAGLPKAPSRYNPITDPQAATGRRAYVLRRMRELGYIDAATAEAANKEPMEARAHAPLFDVEAPVRRRDGAPGAAPALRRRAPRAPATRSTPPSTDGCRRMPTAPCASDSSSTTAATAGADPPVTSNCPRTARRTSMTWWMSMPRSAISPRRSSLAVADKSARVYVKALGPVEIEWEGLSWARKELRNETVGPAPKDAAQILRARRRHLRGRRWQAATRSSARSPRPRARSWHSIRMTAASSRWSEGLTTSPTSTTASRRRGACPARASSPSCTRRPSRMASPRRA